MANNISIDGKLLAAGGMSQFGVTATSTQPAATAQSSVNSTTITTVSSTSLTTLDLTKINALVARVEEIRVLQNAIRDALIATGVIKGSA